MHDAKTTLSAGVARSRAPAGCTKQVLMTLRPEEREQVERIADREGRSLSSTARLLLLRGLEVCAVRHADRPFSGGS